MLVFVLKRLGLFLVAVLAASILVFSLMQVLPGNAAQVALGTNATPEAVADLEARYGLDRPLLVQYADWFGGVLTGDFGESYVTGTTITPVIADSVQVTGILVASSMVLALLVAVPVGTLAALHHDRPFGAVVAVGSQLGVAIPSFLVGILLVMIFSVRLGWLPSSGWVAPIEGIAGFLSHLVLPVVSLALVQSAILVRFVRSAVLEVLGEDFLRTARAVGMTRTRALFAHGLRNAAIPVITVAGIQLATLLIGAVVIEQVFVVPGMGSELVRAVGNRDLVTVEGIVMVLVVAVLLLNLLVDLVYSIVDPRIRQAA